MKTMFRFWPIKWIIFILPLQLLAQSPDTTQLKNLKIARSIIDHAKQCALITLAENGLPQVRAMDPFTPEDDFTIWFATNPKSRKVSQIMKYKNVALYYSDHDNGYVSVYGEAQLVNNGAEKEKRWKPEWNAFYANRNEAYLLIKVIPSRIEFISYKDRINGNSDTWKPEVILFKKH